MPNLTRRSVVAGALLVPFVARAQTWPSGPIRIIVPYPAGGSVDTWRDWRSSGCRSGSV